jgi:two-component system chemotaxis sensor kinase CheA
MSDEFQLSNEELEQLQGMFFEQATETIESLSELILRLERDPADSDALRTIRRAVHTMKGDSAAFGFSDLMQLAHHYEDALDRVDVRADIASRTLIDLLLAGADALAAYIKHFRDGGPLPDTTHLIAGLNSLDEIVTPAAEASVKNATALASSTLPETGSDAVTASAEPKESATVQKDETASQAPEGQAAGGRQPAHSMTLRVESERIDAAMNMVGELIIQRSMIASLTAELEADRNGDDLSRQLSEAVALSARTLSELQESVMRMRLVAIDQVFRRFPRVVRDASIKMGKPLRLEIVGGQTEIDKSIVELISDPLIHLIRNACDHGIEMPEARRAAGKPEEGVITLRARRAGNQIAVEVQDDGAGVNPDRIVASAIRKGLVTEQAVADWTDQQKIALIFLPGFSTAEQVSDMSGRGVGMDVVKSTVDSLGGSVNISSEVGHGSIFTIKLPLTMAIVRAMLFETADQRFALPLDGIREITRLQAGETKTVNGREVLRLRDQVVPLIRLDEALGLRSVTESRAQQRPFVFVLDLGDGRDVGLAVERLYGEQELVLKTVDDKLTQSEVVAGASILGDGQVVLILDPYATVRQATAKVSARSAMKQYA